MTSIKVVIKAPKFLPYDKRIENSSDTIREICEGEYDVHRINEKVCILYRENQQGKDDFNYTLEGRNFYGTIILCGIQGEELCDAPKNTRLALLSAMQF